MRIQSKIRVTRNRETINTQSIETLRSFDLGWSRFSCWRRPELRQTIGDEEDEDDENTVCRTFDFEISEKGVGTEEVKGFVDYISLGGVGWEIIRMIERLGKDTHR